MPAFSFSAKDTEGKTTTGTLIAESEQAVARILRERGLYPQRITSQAEAKRQSVSVGDLLQRAFLGPPLASQMFVFQQLSTMLEAGMSLSQALNSLVTKRRLGRLRKPFVEAQRHVVSGGRLSEVLQRYPWLFSGLQLSMIEAAEASGGLDRAIGQIAEYLDKDLRIRGKFSRGTLYPKALLVVGVLISGLPQFILQGPNAYYGSMSRIFVPVVGGLLALWIVMRLVLQVPPLAVAWDTVKLAAPGLGSMVRKFALAKFARAMSALYSAGIPVASSVELAAKSSGNEFISSRLRKAAAPLRQGVDMHTALSRTGALTGTVEDMLGTGQVTGSVDAMMDKVAEYYEAEAESTMDKTILITGIVVFLLVALFIGHMILSMYGGYYTKPYDEMLKS